MSLEGGGGCLRRGTLTVCISLRVEGEGGRGELGGGGWLLAEGDTYGLHFITG